MTWLVIAALVLFDRIFGWHKIEPVSRLQWSGGYTIFQIILGTLLGAIIVSFIRVMVERIFFVSHLRDIVNMIKNIPNYPMMLPNNPILIRGLIGGMSLGFLIGTIRGLSVPGIAEIDIPNQGIWQSAKNAMLFGIIGAAVMSIAAIVLQWQIVAWSIYGFTFGWIAGGGAACLKHMILRVVLYCSGCIPWNYAKFLDRATELIFLQKVGGGYIFIHRLLLEHFAELKK
ncbi:MAG: hypothetical protein Fur0025_32810 [Oscillatoriaceae cyanobacterium]